jgi:hypothetical protein
MVEKKLFTLACVLGILACGACFGPDKNQSPPVSRPIRIHPPTISPPKPIDLTGIRKILIKVTNSTETHHVDPGVLGRMIASSFNFHEHSYIPRAYTQGAPQPGDAVLQVTIVKEITGPEAAINAQEPPGQFLDLFMDASLTQDDGKVIWSESKLYFRFADTGRWLPSRNPWGSWDFKDWLHNEVATWLYFRIVVGVSF